MRTDLGRNSYRTFFHPHRVDGLFSRSFTAGPGDLVPGHWPSGESEAKLPIAGPVAKRAGEQNYRQQNSTHFRREGFMNLDYAVDRLYEAGWTPDTDTAVERLPDGRWYPTLTAIVREFGKAGLQLSVKHNLMFSCYRATWAPQNEPVDVDHVADERHGTVVGSCEREAAVYALAQLRSYGGVRQLALA